MLPPRTVSALLIAVSLTAASCSGSDPATSGPASPTTVAPSGDRTDPAEILLDEFGPETLPGLEGELAALREANDYQLPLTDALDLFALVLGEIPGGNADRFAVASDDEVEATAVLKEVMFHWDQLTAEQQQAVNTHLGYSPASGFVARPSTPVNDETQSLIDASRAEFSRLVGVDLASPIMATIVADGGTFETEGETTSWAAETWPENADGPGIAVSGQQSTCRIRLTEAYATDAQTVAHEVFHCFQHELAGDLQTLWAAQQWIIEGSAAWAGSIVGGSDDRTLDWFSNWLSAGATFSLEYSAIGFYWVIESMGVDPWRAIGPMLRAGGGVAAVAATGLDPSAVLSRASTSQARAQTLSPLPVDELWDFDANQVPPQGRRSNRTVTEVDPFTYGRARPEFDPGSPGHFTLEGGERVEITATSDVGTLQFFGRETLEPIAWTGRFFETYCLEPDACACGATPLPEGDRQFVLGTGELEGGSLSYSVRIPPSGAFTDGHWQGTLTYSEISLTGPDGLLAIAPNGTFPFELTVVDGAVTGGSYSYTSIGVTVDMPGAVSAIADATVVGTFEGCGFAPQLVQQTVSLVGSMTMASGAEIPLNIEIPSDRTQQIVTPWTFNPGTTATVVSGQLDSTIYTAAVAASGLQPSELNATFEATLIG